MTLKLHLLSFILSCVNCEKEERFCLSFEQNCGEKKKTKTKRGTISTNFTPPIPHLFFPLFFSPRWSDPFVFLCSNSRSLWVTVCRANNNHHCGLTSCLIHTARFRNHSKGHQSNPRQWVQWEEPIADSSHYYMGAISGNSAAGTTCFAEVMNINEICWISVHLLMSFNNTAASEAVCPLRLWI